MRGPVAKIQRTRGTHLERIAAASNVVEVQFSAATNEMLHRGGLERHQFFRVAFELGEKLGVADAGDFDGFNVAGAFVIRRQRGEQIEIVDDGERRRKRADAIFFAEGVDAIFYADAGLGLRKCCRGNADVAQAAMGGRSGKSSDIEQRAAADRDKIRVARYRNVGTTILFFLLFTLPVLTEITIAQL